jgi:hypothetical protein
MSNRMRMMFGGGLVLLLLIAGAVIVLTGDDDKDKLPSPPTTTTTQRSTTTTTAAPALDTSTAVWPVASSSTRYADPVEAARGFATDYVGMANPVLGEFLQGDSRSGEVEIRPFANGPVSTVFVRQLADDNWWILGSATTNIQATAPAALAAITSPVTLAGTSTAFEAQVNVEIREDGNAQALGSGFVMGGGNGDFGPFQSTLTFNAPSQEFGSVFFFTVSPEDGGILEAGVLRIAFA